MQTTRTQDAAAETSTPPAFRIMRGPSGLWEVMEDGLHDALALFRAPQAALSYACDLAAARKGSLVVVFDRLPVHPRAASLQ
ncbi:MAG TPA: hypothetical protein VFV71_07395 [Burkholderiales bacterium]|nr:hypothetical protein [Burkholderiales bacterium]